MDYYLHQLFDILLSPIRLLVSAPEQLLAGGRGLRKLSTPAVAAILVAVFLLITAIVAGVLFFRMDETERAASIWCEPKRLSMIAVVAIAIPIVVYYLVRLWLEPDTSQFPDIDFAWRSILAELQAQGLSLTEIPTFLVLGAASESQETSIFSACPIPLRIRQFPVGPAALHCYAGPDGIFLVCSDVGSMSALAKDNLQNRRDMQFKRAEGGRPSAEPDLGRTVIVGGDGGAFSATAQFSPNKSAVMEAAPAANAARNYGGTIMFESDTMSPTLGPSALSGAAAGGGVRAQPLHRERLKYFCRLVNQAREPLCPINGLLALLPLELLVNPNDLKQAINSDMTILRETLQIRCPALALVTGMEQEEGFRELVRRLGPSRAMQQRFGCSFNVWSPPLDEELLALSAHACGAFEDWAYKLFREKNALNKPGNTALYRLVCAVRQYITKSLESVLVAGFEEKEGTGLLFGGCYFAGTGEREDLQAFVGSVLGKFFDAAPGKQPLLEELEWAPAAQQRERRYYRWAQVVFWIDAALLVGLLACAAYWLLSRES